MIDKYLSPSPGLSDRGSRAGVFVKTSARNANVEDRIIFSLPSSSSTNSYQLAQCVPPPPTVSSLVLYSVELGSFRLTITGSNAQQILSRNVMREGLGLKASKEDEGCVCRGCLRAYDDDGFIDKEDPSWFVEIEPKTRVTCTLILSACTSNAVRCVIVSPDFRTFILTENLPVEDALR